MTTRPLVIIVTPALANANNGNWQTAWRWSRLLSAHYRTCIVQDWRAEYEGVQHPRAVAMLALHARRSAGSIKAWSDSYPGRGLAVVLTGTDLYRDIQTDPSAIQSLDLAQKLLVLQEIGPQALSADHRAKTRVVFQSTSTRKVLAKSHNLLRAVMVGHLREEKSPQTLFETARLLRTRSDIHIDHIGAALDPALGELARQTAAVCPNYRWLGGLDHEATRRHIQRAHLLIHCSRIEGGAHVVMEAVCSGTPVLASRIDGNVGMLGAGYAGYFPWGDGPTLAQLLARCRDDAPAGGQGGASFFSHLQAQCRLRAPLFDPAAERAALLALLHELTAP
jgi:putative glycosyltransferase (TIGR04348 family)